MIIDCISDLHGYYPELEGGDLLIIAGDLTASDTYKEYDKFYSWFENQKYKKKIFIAGNHDNLLVNTPPSKESNHLNFEYLCDTGTEFEGVKLWGSPWTLNFIGQNPKCKAFGLDTEEKLKAKWDLIPDDIDILITHTPPYGVLDEVTNGKNVGSETLIKPMIASGCRFHIFGHIHEAYGKFYNSILGITYINASHVNERYHPVNEPIRVIL